MFRNDVSELFTNNLIAMNVFSWLPQTVYCIECTIRYGIEGAIRKRSSDLSRNLMLVAVVALNKYHKSELARISVLRLY